MFSGRIGHGKLDSRGKGGAFCSLVLGGRLEVDASLPRSGVCDDEQQSPVEVEAIHRARHFARRALATRYRENFIALYHTCATDRPYEFTAEAVANRRLKNLSLSYLMTLEDREILEICQHQFQTADNMTDEIAALSCLMNSGFSEREVALKVFYDKWCHDDLVLDKWFSVQSAVSRPETQDVVRALVRHKDFDLATPNRVRSVIGPFCGLNLTCFHEKTGLGYQFLGDMIEKLDPINPQIASRLVQPLGRWKYYDATRQDKMKQMLQRILNMPGLSENTYEIVSKSLK